METPNYEGAEFYEGDTDTRDASFIAPTITEHVASKLKDWTTFAKEKRKAREERQLKKEKKP